MSKDRELSKDLLFYSNYSDYSKDIIRHITKKSLLERFMLICIDNNRYNLPSFVTVVPLIYTRNKDILFDDAIFKYIESITEENEEISAFSLAGDSFSYINESDDLVGKTFTALGYTQNIPTLSEDTASSNRIKKDDGLFNNYLQNRDNDLKELRRNMQKRENTSQFRLR